MHGLRGKIEGTFLSLIHILVKEYQEDIDAKSKPTGDDAADAGAPATDAAGSTGGTHDADPPEPANSQGGAA